MEHRRQRGWDYSPSVTDAGKKAPILRIEEAMELDEADWQELEAGGAERTITESYRPGRWARGTGPGRCRRDSRGRAGALGARDWGFGGMRYTGQ